MLIYGLRSCRFLILPESLVTQTSPSFALNLLSTFSDLKQPLKNCLRSVHRANFLPFFTLRALMTQQMQQVVCYKGVDLTPFLFSPFDSGRSDRLGGSVTTYCVFHILSFCTNRLFSRLWKTNVTSSGPISMCRKLRLPLSVWRGWHYEGGLQTWNWPLRI